MGKRKSKKACSLCGKSGNIKGDSGTLYCQSCIDEVNDAMASGILDLYCLVDMLRVPDRVADIHTGMNLVLLAMADATVAQGKEDPKKVMQRVEDIPKDAIRVAEAAHHAIWGTKAKLRTHAPAAVMMALISLLAELMEKDFPFDVLKLVISQNKDKIEPVAKRMLGDSAPPGFGGKDKPKEHVPGYM